MQTSRTLAMKYRHRQFLKLYLGRTPIAGNATQCYRAVFGDHLTERSAQVGGYRLLQLDHIKAAIAKAEAKLIDELAIDANFVLAENVRLYNRAMGDDSYDHVEVSTDPATGEDRVSVSERRSYDPATAHKALTSIGQHKAVQAFALNVEHTHTHVLEQRLAARSKLIEGKATQVDAQQLLDVAPGDPTQVDAVPGDVDRGAPADTGGIDEASTGEGKSEKRVHRAEVNDDRGRGKSDPASERAGATP